jgi:hypothetical protein
VCRRDWTITRRALRAHRQAPVRPTPVGRGVLYETLLAQDDAEAEAIEDQVEEQVAEPDEEPVAEKVAPPPPRPAAPVVPLAPPPALDAAAPAVAARSVVDLSTSGPGSPVGVPMPVPRVATSGLVSAHRF